MHALVPLRDLINSLVNRENVFDRLAKSVVGVFVKFTGNEWFEDKLLGHWNVGHLTKSKLVLQRNLRHFKGLPLG